MTRFFNRQSTSINNLAHKRLKILQLIEVKKVFQENGKLLISEICGFALLRQDDNNYVIYVREKNERDRKLWSESQWLAHPQSSLQDGNQLLRSILGTRQTNTEYESELMIDWQKAAKLGLTSQIHDTDDINVQWYGSFEIDLDEDINGIDLGSNQVLSADFIFSLGNTIDYLLEKNWLPSNENHLNWLFYYFMNVPLQLGFFGSFKYIVKDLTQKIENNYLVLDDELSSLACAALGSAYGRVEAKAGASVARNFASDIAADYMIQDNSTETFRYHTSLPVNMGYVQSIPGFSGTTFPSINTLQYLMRLGNRFVNSYYFKSRGKALMRFKAACLYQAMVWHTKRDMFDDQYLKREQLVSRFCYEGSDLAKRDSAGRRIDLKSKMKRDHFVPSINISKYPDLLDIYKNNFNTKLGFENRKTKLNSAVVHYFLHIFNKNQIKIEWDQSLALTLADSESEELRSQAWAYISNNPEVFNLLNATEVLKILKYGDLDIVANLLKFILSQEKYGKKFYFFSKTVLQWVSEIINEDEFTDVDLLIYLKLIASDFIQIWSFDKTAVLKIFIRALKHAKGFRPEGDAKRHYKFGNETSVFEFLLGLMKDLYISPTDICSLYGISDDNEYLGGLFTIIEVDDRTSFIKLVNRFIQSIGYYQEHEKEEIISQFILSSKNSGLEIVKNSLLELDLKTRIKALELIAQSTGSSKILLNHLQHILSNDYEEELISILQMLDKESLNFLWRKESTNLNKVIMNWIGFTSFTWRKNDEIPIKILDSFIQIPTFNKNLVAFITAKDIVKMTYSQSILLIRILKRDPNLVLTSSVIQGLTQAANAELNQIGCEYIKLHDEVDDYWLYLLESNLPVCIQLGFEHLKSKFGDVDFKDCLLAALDSNNTIARNKALELMLKIQDAAQLRSILVALLENRHSDTWPHLYKNLTLIKDSDQINQFTQHVFLTLRKSRSVKENLKNEIDLLTDEIKNLVNEKTILQMTRSSIGKDREWALRKVALGEISSKELVVEQVWGKTNV